MQKIVVAILLLTTTAFSSNKNDDEQNHLMRKNLMFQELESLAPLPKKQRKKPNLTIEIPKEQNVSAFDLMTPVESKKMVFSLEVESLEIKSEVSKKIRKKPSLTIEIPKEKEISSFDLITPVEPKKMDFNFEMNSREVSISNEETQVNIFESKISFKSVETVSSAKQKKRPNLTIVIPEKEEQKQPSAFDLMTPVSSTPKESKISFNEDFSKNSKYVEVDRWAYEEFKTIIRQIKELDEKDSDSRELHDLRSEMCLLANSAEIMYNSPLTARMKWMQHEYLNKMGLGLSIGWKQEKIWKKAALEGRKRGNY
jgi:hypothetical protein